MMGKRADAYDKAREAEMQSKSRWILDPTPQNTADAEQAERAANLTFKEMLEDPEG